MDGQFESTHTRLAAAGIQLNVTGRDEHVGEVEWYIQTVKECMRSTWSQMAFDCLLKKLIVELAKGAVCCLNALPAKNGITDELNLKTIVTGQHIDYNTHCRYQFGEYVQSHEQHDNSIEARTIGALATRPTGNIQGT